MSSIHTISPYSQFDSPQLLSITDPRLKKSRIRSVLDFLGTKDFPKIINYGIQWAGRFTNIAPEVRNVGVFSGNVKNFMSMTKIYGSVHAVRAAVSRLWNKYVDENAQSGEVRDAALSAIREVSSLSNDVCDTAKLGSQFFKIPYVAQIDACAAGWTFLGSLNNLVQDLIAGQTTSTTRQKLINGLALGMDMSYLMVGALGIYAFWMSAAVPLMLVPLTVALICSVSMFWVKETEKLDSAQTQLALDWSLRQLNPIKI